MFKPDIDMTRTLQSCNVRVMLLFKLIWHSAVLSDN